MNRTRRIVGAVALALLLAEVAWLGVTNKRAVPVSRPVGKGLALEVQREGRSLRLAWDRSSEFVRHCNHAILHIHDGMHNTNLDLNTAEVGAGRLVYWPETDHVTFRLEVVAPTGTTAGTIQAPGALALTVEHSEEPAARKPSPFASSRLRRLEQVSIQAVPDLTPESAVPDPTPESNVSQAARPHGSFFGRLAHKIPLVRRFSESPHRPTASPD